VFDKLLSFKELMMMTMTMTISININNNSTSSSRRLAESQDIRDNKIVHETTATSAGQRQKCNAKQSVSYFSHKC